VKTKCNRHRKLEERRRRRRRRGRKEKTARASEAQAMAATKKSTIRDPPTGHGFMHLSPFYLCSLIGAPRICSSTHTHTHTPHTPHGCITWMIL
jgi:hypothetical protein